MPVEVGDTCYKEVGDIGVICFIRCWRYVLLLVTLLVFQSLPHFTQLYVVSLVPRLIWAVDFALVHFTQFHESRCHDNLVLHKNSVNSQILVSRLIWAVNSLLVHITQFHVMTIWFYIKILSILKL